MGMLRSKKNLDKMNFQLEKMRNSRAVIDWKGENKQEEVKGKQQIPSKI